MGNVAGQRPDRAIVFIPGFSPAAEPTGWSSFDQFLQGLKSDKDLAQPTNAGAIPGYRFSGDTLNCDIFVGNWNDRLDRLSAKPLLFRVFRTTALILAGLPTCARQAIGRSWAFAAQTLFGIIALAAFGWFAIAAVISNATNLPGPLAQAFNIHSWWFIALTILFLAIGVTTGDVADIVDAYNRYLCERSGSLRTRLRSHVELLMDEVSSCGYGYITIVAYSFGALIALDVIMRSSIPKLALVTTGASFRYVFAVEPEAVRAILRSTKNNERISKWIDVTSNEDPVAGGASTVDPTLAAVERRVNLTPTFWDYITTTVHSAYFTNETVSAIIRSVALG
jgi:hypothetical protein